MEHILENIFQLHQHVDLIILFKNVSQYNKVQSSDQMIVSTSSMKESTLIHLNVLVYQPKSGDLHSIVILHYLQTTMYFKISLRTKAGFIAISEAIPKIKNL